MILHKFLKILVISCVVLNSSQLCAEEILTLQQTLDIAMQNSPAIRQSRLNLERSRESLNAQKAALKSQFSLSVNPFDYSRFRQFNTFFNTWNTNETKSSSVDFRIAQPITLSDGTLSLMNQFKWQDSFSEFKNERDVSYSNNLYLSYIQPLFTYNRTKLRLKEVELDLENASFSYDLQRLEIEYRVTQSFYDVYQIKLSYEIAIEEAHNQEQSYQIIKNKVDAGLAAKEEFYQAELNLATSRSKAQNQKVLLEDAMDNLKELIGMSIYNDIAVVTDVTHRVVAVDLDKALQNGLKNRMELKQRSIDIQTSYTNLIEAQSINEFKGEMNLTYGIIGTDEQFAAMYQVPTKNQRVLLSVEIPLFDWGERKSRIKSAEAVVESRKLSYHNEENSIIIAIRRLYRNLENLKIQIEIAQQNVKNAELTYDINLERYKNGDLTSMDLNLYQIQLSEKKINLVTALIDYKLALLNIKIQSMWDFERDQPVISDYSSSK